MWSLLLQTLFKIQNQNSSQESRSYIANPTDHGSPLSSGECLLLQQHNEPDRLVAVDGPARASFSRSIPGNLDIICKFILSLCY